MSQKSILALVALGAIAFASNPDEKSFRKFIDLSMKSQGSTWVERKFASQVTSRVYERQVQQMNVNFAIDSY